MMRIVALCKNYKNVTFLVLFSKKIVNITAADVQCPLVAILKELS